MPIINSNGCPLHVTIEGPSTGEPILFSHSLGANLHSWDPQAEALKQRYRVIRYDRRGHGKSGFSPYTGSIELLCRDILAILDELGIESAHYCGLSLGGMEGQWLGAHAPKRLRKLILSNTNHYYADKSLWVNRIESARANGIAPLADTILKNWFTPEFAADAPDVIARMRVGLISTSVEGYIAACEAIRDMDNRAFLPNITAPTLVIAGRRDNATPVQQGEAIRKLIPGASLTLIDAAHISNIELPEQYNDILEGFLGH